MSKATLAVIAAASAATGAGVTALLYGKPRQQQQQQQISPTPTTAGIAAPSAIPGPALAAKAVLGPVNPSGITQYGFPGPVADEISNLVLHGAFDRRTRNPSWVAEHITPESLALNNADRKHSTFTEDT